MKMNNRAQLGKDLLTISKIIQDTPADQRGLLIGMVGFDLTSKDEVSSIGRILIEASLEIGREEDK